MTKEEINVYLLDAVRYGDYEGVEDAIRQGADIHVNDDEALRHSLGAAYVDITEHILSVDKDMTHFVIPRV